MTNYCNHRLPADAAKCAICNQDDTLLFCPSCLGSEENSSWGGEVVPGNCMNCGHGPPVSLPRWASYSESCTETSG